MPDNYYILTGGPGSGKTTLIEALAQSSYSCIPEVAREIISEQIRDNGSALPWQDYVLYTEIMLERSVLSYTETAKKHITNQPVFFDRGIPDTLCYAELTKQPITEKMTAYAREYRYNRNVFILPPWEAIYHTDAERKQSWEEAVATYEQMVQTYRQHGYTIIEVPQDTVENRLAFILQHTKATSKNM